MDSDKESEKRMPILVFTSWTPAVIPLSGRFISESNGGCETVKISEELCSGFDKLQGIALWGRKTGRRSVLWEWCLRSQLTCSLVSYLFTGGCLSGRLNNFYSSRIHCPSVGMSYPKLSSHFRGRR